jgi:hypothetical protein
LVKSILIWGRPKGESTSTALVPVERSEAAIATEIRLVVLFAGGPELLSSREKIPEGMVSREGQSYTPLGLFRQYRWNSPGTAHGAIKPRVKQFNFESLHSISQWGTHLVI